MEQKTMNEHLGSSDLTAESLAAALPPLEGDNVGECLGWHALNYRGAGTLHAQEMYEELESFVLAYAMKAVRMERERCAKLVETTPAEAFCTVMHQAQLRHARETFAKAIRNG
jgi:hypothetical protein